jgi:hypothetical protein
LFQSQEVQKYLRVNQYKEILYFHYESLIELLAAFYAAEILNLALQKNLKKTEIKKKLVGWYSQIQNIIKLASKNGCRVNSTIDSIVKSHDTTSI